MLINSIKRGCRYFVSRRVYFVSLVLVPIAFTLFFIDLMDEGLPLKVPTAIVDLDDSPLSRTITRNLNAGELLDIRYKSESFHDAIDKVRGGEIFGFFMIPERFQEKALGGDKPTITYYSNMTYFVPGTLSFKGFKSVAVTTAGGIVQTTLVGMGLDEGTAGNLLQPVVVDNHPIGNPWLNYSIYLCNSFIPGVIALMVMLVTAYSICDEIKKGTSVQWLREGGNSMLISLIGKLAPQSFMAICVGVFIQSLLYGYNHFPLNNHAMHMIAAMVLLVIGCQAFAVTICCILPNLRLAVSILSLVGILSFSITGFSFPVQSMYGGIGIFSYLIPLRYYFLIYVDQALNGIPIFYSRWYYIALLSFPLISLLGLWKLKRRCLNPVYVP